MWHTSLDVNKTRVINIRSDHQLQSIYKIDGQTVSLTWSESTECIRVTCIKHNILQICYTIQQGMVTIHISQPIKC
jgi:hypothetical protein